MGVMKEHVRLGRVRGVPIGLNGSFVFIAAAVTLSVSTLHLPLTAPGSTAPVYWSAGLVTAAGFLLSILVHEMGHVLVAQRHGITCQGVVLWLLGGVAKFNRVETTPGVEARVALAGPAAGFAMAVLFGLAAGALNAAGYPMVGAVASLLASVNVLLSAFNLLPALPLDGGRIVVAAIWRLRGDRDRARTISAQAGRILAVAIGLWGAWTMIRGDHANGLWVALLAWFLFSAASDEIFSTSIESAVAGMTVGEIMVPLGRAARVGDAPGDVIDHFDRLRPAVARPVHNATGDLVGLVSTRRLWRAENEHAPTIDNITTPVHELLVCPPDIELIDALVQMQFDDLRAGIVVDGLGRPKGFFGATQVRRAVLEGSGTLAAHERS